MRLEYEITKDEDDIYLVVHPKVMLRFEVSVDERKNEKKKGNLI